jgi:hypothetical protein
MFAVRGCETCNNCKDCCKCWHCNVCDNNFHDQYYKCSNCNNCKDCCECENGVSFFKQDPPVFHDAVKTKFKINPSKRHIAAEIEVAGVKSEFISDPNVPTISRVVKKWQGAIVEDGSLPSDGFEINTAPASGDLYVEQIKEICDILNSRDAKVNNSCGLHIHVNAQDHNFYDIKKLAYLYEKIEPALFSIISPGRKSSRYCLPCGPKYVVNLEKGIYPKDTEKILKKNIYNNEDENKHYLRTNKYHDARYNAMNLHSWVYRGSIEFRMHHGTTNARKIQNWGILLAGILDFAYENNEFDIRSLKGDPFSLLLEVAPTQAVKEWVVERKKEFGAE